MNAWYEARRPRRFLDGCCGIGGISHGLAGTGHEVWGVDSNPRLRDDYLRSGAAEFVCADILEVLADPGFMGRFDFAHVSPPCQHFSAMCACRPGLATTYPDLITPAQPLLDAWGGPFVIENVERARRWLRDPVTVCMWGHFGRETYRHRLLEAGGGLVLTPPPEHSLRGGIKPNRSCGCPHPVPTARAGHWQPGYFVSVAGHERKEPVRRVMEISWARNRDDVKEAVPPYVGAWIAEQAQAHLARQATQLRIRRICLMQGAADVGAAETGIVRSVPRIRHHLADPLVHLSFEREGILRSTVRSRGGDMAGSVQRPSHTGDPTPGTGARSCSSRSRICPAHSRNVSALPRW